MRRNPARFLVDSIMAESPLQTAFRKRYEKKNWLWTYGKNKYQRMIGIDVGDPAGDYAVETLVYVDHEGVHIVG